MTWGSHEDSIRTVTNHRVGSAEGRQGAWKEGSPDLSTVQKMAGLPSYPEAALWSLILQEGLRGLWCVLAWFLLSWRELGAEEVTVCGSQGPSGTLG